MTKKNWPRIIYGSLCGIIAASIPFGTAIAMHEPNIVYSSIPGLLHATYSAYRGLVDIQNEILKSPLAYAAIAQMQFNASVSNMRVHSISNGHKPRKCEC